MMEHGTVFLDVLTISNRLRRLDAAKVESIAASMDVLGLQQPVSIWASEDGAVVDLVAGAHRVAAAQKLGWEKIDCIFVNMDEIDRQLWEIDENLMRADLGPAELAQHTAKRADLVRQKAAIVNSQNEKKLAQRPSEGQSDFDEETTNATGKSKSTVRRVVLHVGVHQRFPIQTRTGSGLLRLPITTPWRRHILKQRPPSPASPP